MKYCFGVDIGGTTVKLGLFSEAGAIVEKWEIVTRTENEGAAILPDVAEAINGKLEQHGIEKEQVLGIGVGVPAPVTVDGIVNGSANLGWKYKNAKKELEELTGLTAEFGNDANVAALGEMWKGGGVGYRNMIMVTLGTGVGGGIIINGKILTGENGAGGEIGHMCVNLEEIDTCGCGGHGLFCRRGELGGPEWHRPGHRGRELCPLCLSDPGAGVHLPVPGPPGPGRDGPGRGGEPAGRLC